MLDDIAEDAKFALLVDRVGANSITRVRDAAHRKAVRARIEKALVKIEVEVPADPHATK